MATSIVVDSEGFEIVEAADLPTPSTIEIFKCVSPCLSSPWPTLTLSRNSDPDRTATPRPAERASAKVLDGSDDSQPSSTSGYCTADTSRSSKPSTAKEPPPGLSTPGNHGAPCSKHSACPHCCSEALDKPHLLDDDDDDVPDLSPNTYIYVRNLGLHSPDGSFSEHWANNPVSFIPSTSKLGPRELDPGHYACPYPGCIDPFGPCSRPDGYTRRGLALHIYRRHGYGPAVDRVRLDLRKRVMALRLVRGRDTGGAPLPCGWRDLERDLARATIALTQDLEEIRRWERSSRLNVQQNEVVACVKPALGTEVAAVPDKEMSVCAVDKSEVTGKQRAITWKEKDFDHFRWTESSPRRGQCDLETDIEVLSSPSSYARTNHFARLRDNRFQRHRGASLLHMKEVFRSPKKRCGRDDDEFMGLG